MNLRRWFVVYYPPGRCSEVQAVMTTDSNGVLYDCPEWELVGYNIEDLIKWGRAIVEAI